jgi:glycosyltransferase involved in cell wall biosynthesis
MNNITIVVPCYNEENNIQNFYDKVKTILDKLNKEYNATYKFLFVDDGSSDNTPDILKQLNKEQSEFVDIIILSRNFGKEAALYAGLSNSQSEYTAVMDADLQDPPELLEEMYLGIVNEGYDCVAARRKNRKGEPIIRSLFSKLFYWFMQKLSKLPIADGARDFRLFNKPMLKALLTLQQANRFSKRLFPWVGLKTKWLESDNIERSSGISKWSFTKLLFYALDGITAFSSVPLIAVSIFGIVSMIISLLMIVFVIVRKILYGDPVAGWPSLVCIILFTSSIQYFFIGVLGYYIAKIYNETKRRPQYLIRYSSFQ